VVLTDLRGGTGVDAVVDFVRTRLGATALP
jgi:hypothetical protein